VTIAAGFVCAEGLVLFADTEEQEGYMKTSAEKIRSSSGKDWHCIIANSGHGALADSLIDRIFETLESAPPGANSKLLKGLIRKIVVSFHRDEIALYPSENSLKMVGLILGLQVGSDFPVLLHADATALKQVETYAVIGYGSEIKFLAEELYSKGMPLKHGVLIANYLVKTAKDHVQGCGGDSRIATLEIGKLESIHSFDIWDQQYLFSHLSSNYRAVLLSIPDGDISDEQFNNCVNWFVEEAWKERNEMMSHKQFNDEVKQKQKEYQRTAKTGIERYYEPVKDVFSLAPDRRLNLQSKAPKQLVAGKSEQVL
jgi:hypothetical protein